jgi:hypothetical protein
MHPVNKCPPDLDVAKHCARRDFQRTPSACHACTRAPRTCRRQARTCTRSPQRPRTHLPGQNVFVESRFPPEQYRDDLGLLWYADISMTDGRLGQLTVTPTRLRCGVLEPARQCARWLSAERFRASRGGG